MAINVMGSDKLNVKELLELEAEYCSYGDTVHYAERPKIFERAEGSWLFDAEEKPYLDVQMWYSAVNFGYRNKEIEDGVLRQMARLPQLATQYLHKEKILLAAEIARQTETRFGEKGRVHFNVGGSQAVEDAIKLIRSQRNGKSQMLAFMGGYHGRTLAATELTSSFRYRTRYGHFGNRAALVPYPYCYRCFYGKTKDNCAFECVRHFEKLFESEYYGVIDSKDNSVEYAAFFIEPIQGTGGYVIPPQGYFEKLSKILRKHGILIVDDEIQMGFYRTGKLWAAEHFGIKPDIITFAKSLTNGLNPLSGIWAKEELINPGAFPAGSTHSTFASNPLGTAAGLATLEYCKRHDIAKAVMEKGAYMLERLKDLKKRYNVIGDVDGIGLALRLEMTKADGFAPDRNLCDRIFQEGMNHGIKIDGKEYGLILDVGGYYKNTFTLAPALTITYEEIDLFAKLFEALLNRCGAAPR